MEGLPLVQPWRWGSLPALFMLVFWPAYLLIAPRHTRQFFIITGLLLSTLLSGPLLTGGILLAVLLSYAVIESAARHENARTPALAGLLIGLHAAYWACFSLPVPSVFAALDIHPANAPTIFILFSGIGLTFFRLVSYAQDRLRLGKSAVSLLDFLAYMLFFPLLLHGPIERAIPFCQRLRTTRGTLQPRDFALGLGRCAWGFGLLAAAALALQGIAEQTNGTTGPSPLSHPEAYATWQLLLLLHLGPGLLYLIESCLTHVQLGSARAFGVRASENYAHPYQASTPQNLWQRWNITLSSWLRDYAFKPLGGMRRRHLLNIVLTFVYCGLLHGLQWRFVVWGLWTGGMVAAWALTRHQTRGWPRRDPSSVTLAIVSRVITFYWLAAGIIILIDHEHCGWRFFHAIAASLLAP